jgi:hypothetical protein
MLLALNIAQLVAYIGLLALAGQGLLYVLAGAGRESNLVYQLFLVLNKPWTRAASWISPRQVAQRHHPVVAFCVLAVLYMAVTLAKIEYCIGIGVENCR